MEDNFIVFEVDVDLPNPFEFGPKQPLGKRVLDQALDRPLERPRTEVRVEALVDQIVPRLGGQVDPWGSF